MKKFTLFLVAVFFYGVLSAQSVQNQTVNLSRNKGGNSASVQRNPVANAVNPATVIFTDNMEGDNTVAGLVSRGYSTYFRGVGGPGVLPEWIQGDNTTFNAYNGSDTSYTASSYNSVTGANDMDNWLVLPAQNLAVGDSFSFWAATVIQTPPPFADSIRVMYNPTGATLPEDLNWVELDRFELDWATGNWTRYAYAVPSASATGVFAIRHAVIESGPLGNNGNYIGIDQIDIFNSIVVPGGTFDTCTYAIDISSTFGGAIGVENVTGPYDNTNATTDALDPVAGWSCYGEPDGSGTAPELNNTVWFTFTGDGNTYFVESGNCAGVTNYIDDGDTQFSLYTGNCGSLTALKCNEDGPNATATTYPAGFTFGTILGATYYLMVDGFSFNGTVSTGEFCIKVTRQPNITCGDPTVTVGTTSQNNTTFCLAEGDTIRVTATGAIAPNVGDVFGISMVISTAPLTAPDPTADPAAIGFYGFASPAPASFLRSLINDGTFLMTAGTYYFTPLVFGNATILNVPTTFLNDLTLDPACITLGTPALVTIVDQSDPFCTISIAENLPGKSTSVAVYPSPVADNLNVDFTSANRTDCELTIVDYIGRVVIEKTVTTVGGINKTAVNVKHLAGGSYFVTLTDDSGIRTVKFVKN